MFVGVRASRVRDLFRQAKEKAPCIVFIDEIDAVGRARSRNAGMGSNDEREKYPKPAAYRDGWFWQQQRRDYSWPLPTAPTYSTKALLRAGRFDRQIYVDLPDLPDRVAIFKVHLRKVKTAPDLDIDLLARQTPDFQELT